MSRARKSASIVVPRCPTHLANILRVLGLLRVAFRKEGSTKEKEVEEAITWISRYIHERCAIPRRRTLIAIHSLANNQDLEGINNPRIPDIYGSDLTDVMLALGKPDNEGTTAKLWYELGKKWPKLRSIFEKLGSAGSRKRKRSTERGEGQKKLIAALAKHHRYADGGCLNPDPIGSNELAREAVVSPSTASAFFNDKFKGYAKYRVVCRDAGRLADSLKALNDDFSPHDLYGRRPAGEDDRDKESDE